MNSEIHTRIKGVHTLMQPELHQIANKLGLGFHQTLSNKERKEDQKFSRPANFSVNKATTVLLMFLCPFFKPHFKNICKYFILIGCHCKKVSLTMHILFCLYITSGYILSVFVLHLIA
jgi:hypothetical protein